MKTWRRKITNEKQLEWAVEAKWPVETGRYSVKRDYIIARYLKMGVLYGFQSNGELIGTDKGLIKDDLNIFLVPKTVDELVEVDEVYYIDLSNNYNQPTGKKGYVSKIQGNTVDFQGLWGESETLNKEELEVKFIPALPEDIFPNEE